MVKMFVPTTSQIWENRACEEAKQKQRKLSFQVIVSFGHMYLPPLPVNISDGVEDVAP